MDTDQRIKVPVLEFSELTWFIGIWMLIIKNHGNNQMEYFSETLVDIFGG